MIRVITFLSLGALTCAVALRGSSPEKATYVDGNLTGVSPNSSGTLLFPDDRAMVFEAGGDSIQVPYATISKADLGAMRVHSPQVPVYKVWALSKRITGRTRTQLLTVVFKGEEGEDVSMTLELARAAAPDVLATINGHTGKGPMVAAAPPRVKLTEDQVMAAGPAESSKASWWGDDYWKTERNSNKWNNVQATNTPRQ